MGRQTLLHMLPKDTGAFLNFIVHQAPVVIVQRDSTSPKVHALTKLHAKESRTLCLWNKKLIADLMREFVPESDEGPYYRVDTLGLPVLELELPIRKTWQGKPALCQGRLFGNFEKYLRKPPEFEEWYTTLVRWVRKNFVKNPANLGGYVGPEALIFFQKGGLLLPIFSPPLTSEWLTALRKQHERKP